MTKIILAFPCMGKTYYAKHNPERAIDLESSDYFFDKTGFEHLDSETFKGLQNRKLNPTGLTDYLQAIDNAVKSDKYEYVFTSQSPNVVKGILSLGYQVHYVKPIPSKTSEYEFVRRAKQRGNNDAWIDSTIQYLAPLPFDQFTDEEQSNIFVHLVPSQMYLADVINEGSL